MSSTPGLRRLRHFFFVTFFVGLAVGVWLANGAQAVQKFLPAFPGAEGYGAFTPGGRGGKVIYVTTLEDYNPAKGETPIPGSLRNAVATPGPRTILFRVSGTIFLKRGLVVREPYLTIAGQTAPGGGICIARYIFRVVTHDVIIRFLRFRLGDDTRSEMGTFQVVGGQDVVVDHCSISWSMDENCTLHGSEAGNLTLQWCLISESLNRSYHPKGEHGHGSLLRSAEGGFTIHHCVYAHNNGRNPRPGGYTDTPGLLLDFRNNIVYDWGQICGYSGFERTRINYVANYFKPGPSTSDAARRYAFSVKTFRTQMFLENNFMPDRQEENADNWLMIRKWGQFDGNPRDRNAVVKPFPAPPVTIDPPEIAFEKILTGVGATLPERDSVDARIVDDIRSGTGHLIDSQKDVGGWPELKGSAPPEDSDNDGIPDDWERKHGLDPGDPSDANKVAGDDGYTYLEKYLNSMCPELADPKGTNCDFSAVLSELDKLNAKAWSEIEEEKKHRPADGGMDGAPPAPIVQMEVRPGKPASAPNSVGIILDRNIDLGLNRIPAGTFTMGSPENEPERGDDEVAHSVTISHPFYMGNTFVTASQFAKVMGQKPVAGGRGDLPAEVPWPEAVRFCKALSRNTGHTFRLPTEAEWEYACRAGTTTPFNTGATITTDQANFDGKFAYPGSKPGIYRRSPTPVRTFPPNQWGMYDMHGNGYEWCSDWYGRYPEHSVIDPRGPDKGTTRVIRGGKHGSGARYIRSAARYSYKPNDSSAVFGFRIVMETEHDAAHRASTSNSQARRGT